jgi:hypothetical protein
MSVSFYVVKSLEEVVEVHILETSRLPHFLGNPLTEGGEVVSLTSPFALMRIFETVNPRAIVPLEQLVQFKSAVT